MTTTTTTLRAMPEACRPDHIRTRAEALRWLEALDAAGLTWHPEDDPRTVGGHDGDRWVPLFAPRAAARMDRLMREVYDLPDLDPCAVLLDLFAERESER